MEESSPERPALFFDFVLPPWSEDLFSDLWIADPHSTTPMLDGLENCEEVPRNDPRLDCAASNTNVAIRQFTHSPVCGAVGEIRICSNDITLSCPLPTFCHPQLPKSWVLIMSRLANCPDGFRIDDDTLKMCPAPSHQFCESSRCTAPRSTFAPLTISCGRENSSGE